MSQKPVTITGGMVSHRPITITDSMFETLMYCHWRQDKQDNDTWQTSCEQRFIITAGTPSDNNMAFCCYCGRRLIEHTEAES